MRVMGVAVDRVQHGGDSEAEGRTLLAPRAIPTAAVALALQLHGVLYPGDAGNPARNLLSVKQFIRRPDVTAEMRHAVIDADFDIAEIVDRIGLQCRVDPLGSGGVGTFLVG